MQVIIATISEVISLMADIRKHTKVGLKSLHNYVRRMERLSTTLIYHIIPTVLEHFGPIRVYFY